MSSSTHSRNTSNTSRSTRISGNSDSTHTSHDTSATSPSSVYSFDASEGGTKPISSDGQDAETKARSSFKMSLLPALGEWRIYLSASIFVVASTLILGIICLSFLNPKIEPLLFGLDILSILLSLGTFSALCFFIQRSKDQKYGDDPWDPNLVDIGCALGIVALFGFSAATQLTPLPPRCFPGPEASQVDIRKAKMGPAICGVLVTMGSLSSLGGLIMLLSTALIALSIREAKRIAALPPPVFPGGAEASVLRWLDRNDPFALASRQTQPPRASVPARSNTLPAPPSAPDASASEPVIRNAILDGSAAAPPNKTTGLRSLTLQAAPTSNPSSARVPQRSASLDSPSPITPGMTEVSFQGLRTPLSQAHAAYSQNYGGRSPVGPSFGSRDNSGGRSPAGGYSGSHSYSQSYGGRSPGGYGAPRSPAGYGNRTPRTPGGSCGGGYGGYGGPMPSAGVNPWGSARR